MHLGNGAITPECIAVTASAAAAGLAASAMALRTIGITRDKLQLAAMLGFGVFAAQAVNVPVAPGFSAHLVGGVLVAWAVGPALGAWTMATVLAAQALVLDDGGIAALGANIVNMALVPTAIVTIAGRTGTMGRNRPVAMGVAAGLAVVLAAALIVGETAMFRPLTELTQWPDFALRMIGYHAWIGTIEGVATAAMIGLAVAPAWRKRSWAPAIVGFTAVAFVAILLSMASSLPDGYEAATQASGMEWLLLAQ